jgi:ATP-dependent RNA helicase RhlE
LVKFEQLSLAPRVLAGATDAGYITPTPIQQQAIPIVLQGRDVLGLAQTGTGKTAAFLLPIFNRLLTGKLGKVRALIVAPTRELAEQIHQAAVQLGKHTKARSVTVYGGVGKRGQEAALRRGAEIIVATPGRLLDHMGDRTIDLSNVEVLVLDEADRMCDMGFLPDIRRIVAALPKQRQTLFFSATMPPDIRALADSILTDPETVQVDAIAPAKTVAHALYPVPEGLKTKLLLAMLRQTETDRVLVFTRTKRRARNLANDLEKAGHNVAALQGNMAQNARTEALNGFRSGRYDVLVATDIAARGIDVTEISHVINFDMPDTVDAYTHRIGRTGRAEHSGEAFTLVQPMDEPSVRAIEKVLGERIERRRVDRFDYGTFVPEAQGQAPTPAPSNPLRGTRNSGRGHGGRPARTTYAPRPAAAMAVHGANGQVVAGSAAASHTPNGHTAHGHTPAAPGKWPARTTSPRPLRQISRRTGV